MSDTRPGAPETIEIAEGVFYTYPVALCVNHGGQRRASEHGGMLTARCPKCGLLHPIPVSSALPSKR